MANASPTALDGALDGRVEPLSWAEILADQRGDHDPRRRFLLLRPVQLKPDEVDRRTAMRSRPSEKRGCASSDLDERLRACGCASRATMRCRSRRSEIVSSQAASAGLASLRRGDLHPDAGACARVGWWLSIVMLAAGGTLASPPASPPSSIGHFNLISVAFAVLFIGLGVDFGIHFCGGLPRAASRSRHARRGAPRHGPRRGHLARATVRRHHGAGLLRLRAHGLSRCGGARDSSRARECSSACFCMVTVLPALISLRPLALGRH